MRQALLGAGLWSMILWVLATPGHGDTPLPPPALKEVWSPNRVYCAVMDPRAMTTSVYKVSGNGARTPTWATHGWFRVAALTDDGDHLVIGHPGINLLPLNVTMDDAILTFLRRGELIGVVRLGELLTNPRSLKRTASHYLWGSYGGLDQNGLYVIQTVEERRLRFDPATGRRVLDARL